MMMMPGVMFPPEMMMMPGDPFPVMPGMMMPGVTPCAGISDTAITHTRLPRCWPPGEWMVPGVMPGAGVFDTAYTDTRPTKNHYYGRHSTKMKPNGGRNGMSLITAAWHEQNRQQDETEQQDMLQKEVVSDTMADVQEEQEIQKEMVHYDSENVSVSTEPGDVSSNECSQMSRDVSSNEICNNADGQTDESFLTPATQAPSAHRLNTPYRPPPGLDLAPQDTFTADVQAEDLKDETNEEAPQEELPAAAKAVAPKELKAEAWTEICPSC